MTLKTKLGTAAGVRLLSNSSASFFEFVCILLLFSMSISASSAAQIVSSPTESNEIDGSGIINTPYHNSSSALWNIPWVGNSLTPLPIGRLCEHDSDCSNFSVCRLVISNQETTKKICECDSLEMKQVNSSCYVKPGHQCYFPHKNSHGYSFIPCFPGSACKLSVNKTSPRNGYCMCKVPPVEDHYRFVNAEFEMARCSAAYLSAIGIPSFGCFVFGMIALSVHSILKLLINDR